MQNILSTNGNHAERVHFIGSSIDVADIDQKLVDSIALLKYLTHLHVERYYIYADQNEKMVVEQLLKCHQAVHLISFKLIACTSVTHKYFDPYRFIIEDWVRILPGSFLQ